MSRIDFSNPIQCEEYEAFVCQHQNGCFMQSLKWANLKKDWQHEAVLVKNEDGQAVGVALILIKQVPLFNTCLFYLPHGPVWDFADAGAFQAVMQEVNELAHQYNAYQCLIDPLILEQDSDSIAALQAQGLAFKADAKELHTAQARNNYMLPLTGKTEQEIFAAFHPKWRYNIRLAGRKQVECRVCGEEVLGDFYAILKETAKRDGFSIRSQAYFSRMLQTLGKHCRLYMCYHEGVPLSGAITTQYAGKTCYVYGASSNSHRNLMPNYLMQWRMIQWAIEKGCKVYDFQGIPFYTDTSHPNYGVYRFKCGFSGGVVTYAGEFTQTYKPMLAQIVNFAVKLRWLKAAAKRLVLVTSKKIQAGTFSLFRPASQTKAPLPSKQP